jgi:hypothetical protein
MLADSEITPMHSFIFQVRSLFPFACRRILVINVRERLSFWSRTTKQASNSSTDQGRGRRVILRFEGSDSKAVSSTEPTALPSSPYASPDTQGCCRRQWNERSPTTPGPARQVCFPPAAFLRPLTYGSRWVDALRREPAVPLMEIRLKFRHCGQMHREWIFESPLCQFNNLFRVVIERVATPNALERKSRYQRKEFSQLRVSRPKPASHVFGEIVTQTFCSQFRNGNQRIFPLALIEENCLR